MNVPTLLARRFLDDRLRVVRYDWIAPKFPVDDSTIEIDNVRDPFGPGNAARDRRTCSGAAQEDNGFITGQVGNIVHHAAKERIS